MGTKHSPKVYCTCNLLLKHIAFSTFSLPPLRSQLEHIYGVVANAKTNIKAFLKLRGKKSFYYYFYSSQSKTHPI